MPESLGGSTSADNLALACQGCNCAKGNKTQALDPATGRWVSLFHPRRDNWAEHFVWGRDHLFLIGLTPVGRATVQALELNRPGVIHLRQLLVLNREHPPSHRPAAN